MDGWHRPRLAPLLSITASLLGTVALSAQSPPCRPCAGIRVNDPTAVVETLADLPPIGEPGSLYVSWKADLDAPEESGTVTEKLRELRGVAWPLVTLTTPAPVLERVGDLDGELEKVATLSRALGERAHIQIDWQPASGEVSAAELAFVIKRTAAAVSGANPDARVILGPLTGAADLPSFLEDLYSEETQAYIDGLAVTPEAAVETIVESLHRLAPGTPLVVDGRPLSSAGGSALAAAARDAEAGAAVTMFVGDPLDPSQLGALALVAREFAGDVSYDPYSTPAGVDAWAFVRGDDLSLRVIAEVGSLESATLRFSDPTLSEPQLLRPESTEAERLFGLRGSDRSLEVTITDAARPWVLRLDRISAAEIAGLEGVEEELTVATERQMPVSEILRRLQAVEDDQRRRLDHYSATNTTHLRFGGGDESLEATFSGDFFFRRDASWDWAWQDFKINGVRWRSNKIPEIPLVEPEKAAALPLEIHFTKEYDYRLRGTEVIDGRDCWVVDFEPRVVDETENPYRGTVWIDRQHYFRVRTRALQLGLSGDVVSNEETSYFRPLDTDGTTADWDGAAFVLPTRTVAQQVFNYFNANTLVEKETLLSALTINGAAFEERRQAVLASKTTMVRDTSGGMRYLVDDGGGQRVVQKEFDTSRLFALGGAFHDESLDNPVPLGGVNWVDFDLRDSGQQVNVFFAGVLAIGNWSDPTFLGSSFTAAADLFALGVKGDDEIFRDGVEVPGEEVEVGTSSLSLELGHDLGQRGRAALDYTFARRSFADSDNTADGFILPTDHWEHQFTLRGRYDRAGYRLGGNVTAHSRGDWQPWGTPADLAAFDPATDGFSTWGVSLGKTFHLPRFMKVYTELETVGGSDLDRFSKYDFGFFSDVRVRGYRSGLVRAEEAAALHLGYGFDLAEILQLQLRGDAAWATDEASGLDNEFLGGIGIQGNFIGPWNTLVRLDLGKAVAGPDDGVSVFVAVLKLFG